jgi:hypothetical protein
MSKGIQNYDMFVVLMNVIIRIDHILKEAWQRFLDSAVNIYFYFLLAK